MCGLPFTSFEVWDLVKYCGADGRVHGMDTQFEVSVESWDGGKALIGPCVE